MRKHLKATLLLASLVPLSGCAGSIAGIADIKHICGPSGAWKAISVSKDDKLTEKTATEIEGNNRAREEIGCDKGGAV